MLQARPLGQFQPVAPSLNKLFYSFSISFKRDSNFRNSYLFKYMSKNHETCSVGFLISSSIKEKYQTEQ
jgi:hypothetical protein